MLKIWSMKKEQQKQENADAAGGKKKESYCRPTKSTKRSAVLHILTLSRLKQFADHGALFLSVDLSELSLGTTMKTIFPNPDDILNFILEIKPDEGVYTGGKFTFTFNMTQGYPHEPPKVLCQQKIYHPNIDLEGKVCLNILREDWKPVLNLNAVIVGLQFLFLEPNASDPLNKEAADDLRASRDSFRRNVKNSMSGGSVRGNTYDNVLISQSRR
ncbi:hypothetical protein GQX73_g3315 [Xylaria multiplex]|uniref:NEDD8-conjugating enzyme UBC12 n=1 Tax=Xylaria multiplex TaxID=323545 RepID=A0A7C8IR83_9PEZI|nr:hypothetical protein GQX73_g3315 [Xylaria multiplex]